jgi:hypothetical protein
MMKIQLILDDVMRRGAVRCGEGAGNSPSSSPAVHGVQRQ